MHGLYPAASASAAVSKYSMFSGLGGLDLHDGLQYMPVLLTA